MYPAVICTLLLYVLPDGQFLLLYVPCCYMYCQTASPCCYMYWSRPWLWPWHSQGQFEPLCVAKSLPIYAKSYNLTGELIGRETVRGGWGGGRYCCVWCCQLVIKYQVVSSLLTGCEDQLSRSKSSVAVVIVTTLLVQEGFNGGQICCLDCVNNWHLSMERLSQ